MLRVVHYVCFFPEWAVSAAGPVVLVETSNVKVHTRGGSELYPLCVDMLAFYLLRYPSPEIHIQCKLYVGF